jgi:predicted double-glycine peptidase
MNSVTQEHEMACGLACVAYVTNTPYKKIADEQANEKLNKYGFICPELVSILKDLGFNYSWKKLSDKDSREFNQGDIVFVKRSKQYSEGHFLAKTSNGWMDPWINVTDKNPTIAKAKSGFRDELPGEAEYLVFKTS